MAQTIPTTVAAHKKSSATSGQSIGRAFLTLDVPAMKCDGQKYRIAEFPSHQDEL
jgi:hypothetical protein